MLPIRITLRAATGIAALALALPAAAQSDTLPPLPGAAPEVGSQITPMSAAERQTLPAEYRSLPAGGETTTTIVGDDGVETITRTRRITASAPAGTATYPAAYQGPAQGQPTYYQTAYAPTSYPAPAHGPAYSYAPVVLDREQWITECERRTDGRNDSDKGTIIGGLLGAIGGGFAGYELAAAGEALGSTLIGVGVGGLAGMLIGSLFDDDDEERYDCEAALDAYLDQYGQDGARIASRTIPVQATAPIAYPAYVYAYSQQPAYYPAPQTVTVVPVTTYQQQRVIVRETVREEAVPGAVRSIPAAPAPLPQPVRIPQPAPSPKMIKN